MASAQGRSWATWRRRWSSESSGRKDVRSGVGMLSMGRNSCLMILSILHDALWETFLSLTDADEEGVADMRMTCRFYVNISQ